MEAIVEIELRASRSDQGLLLQEGLHDFLEGLHHRGLPAALQTLNGNEGVDEFFQAANLAPGTHPVTDIFLDSSRIHPSHYEGVCARKILEPFDTLTFLTYFLD